MAGDLWVARHLPVRVGRGPGMDLQLTETGVWDEHLQLDLKTPEGFVLTAAPDTSFTIDQKAFQRAVLRNGDQIQVGSVKLQFWLRDTRQRTSAVREWATWIGIALFSLGQVALVYWLLGK